MSLIADALQKANVPSIVPPTTPRSPRPTWIYWGAGLLGLALIFFWVRSSAQVPSSSAPIPTPTTAAISDPPTASTSTTAAVSDSSQPPGSDLLRTAENQWRLSGIIQGGNGEPLALLNDQVVEEGQPIEGSEVVRIASNEVEVETDGKVRRLKLR